MFRRTIALLLVVFAVSVFLSHRPAQAGRPPAKIYKLNWVATALGFPDSNAGGINDAGDVVGIAWWPTVTEAFLYTGGVLHNLNDRAGMPDVDVGWRLLSGTDINNDGQIVGGAEYRELLGWDGDYPVYKQDWGVFRYTPGVGVEILSSLTTAGVYKFESATAINDAGVMTGIAEVAETQRRFAFEYTPDGQLIELPGPAGGIGVWQPNAINDSGRMAGVGRVDGITTARRYDPAPINETASHLAGSERRALTRGALPTILISSA